MKLSEIIQTMSENFTKNPNFLLEKGIGLYTGQSGILLFLAYYSNYINHKYINFYHNYADLYVDNLASNFISSFSFCDGISGALFTLKHLKEKKLLNLDIRQAENYFDNYLTL